MNATWVCSLIVTILTTQASNLQAQQASNLQPEKCETETFGANITVDGSSGVSLGVLKNDYSDGVTLGEWAHVALTVNTSTGDVKTIRQWSRI